MIGEGPAARRRQLDLPPFTLVGATTRAGTSPKSAARPVWHRSAPRILFGGGTDAHREAIGDIIDIVLDPEGALEIARRSRGTPRIVNRLLRRVRDFAEVKADGEITAQCRRRRTIDARRRWRWLTSWTASFSDGVAEIRRRPVGVDNLSAAIGEERDTIEDVLEPVLIQQGYLQRTSRGRVATALSYRHFGLSPPTPGAAGELFPE